MGSCFRGGVLECRTIPGSACVAGVVEVQCSAFARGGFQFPRVKTARVEKHCRAGGSQQVALHAGNDIIGPIVHQTVVGFRNDAETMVGLGHIREVINERNRLDFLTPFVVARDVAMQL